MCAIFCREAGDGVCPIYYFNATDSTCTFGDIEGDLGLVPHGQGVKAMTYIGAPELTVERSKLKIYANAVSLCKAWSISVGPSHAIIMGSHGKGCANIIYRLVPEPAKIPVYPERPQSECFGQVVIEYDNGILACGGGNTRTCHHLRWVKKP